ncbi:MAG: hypothetical protein RLZZ301_828 [Bacteroidota bacterium]
MGKLLQLAIYLLFMASCLRAQSIGGVVNTYVAVTAINSNSVAVTSVSGFSVGDRVLLIQMKGAIINTTNSASFGQISNLSNAGNFEFTNIASISTNVITFVTNLCKPFTLTGKVQLIRVPVYTQATINAPITATPWNGSIGGVVAIEATVSLTFNSGITVSGQGFQGGATTSGWFACNDVNYATAGTASGKKGEGIAVAPVNMDGNRAPLASGGGGSNSGNPGAGGGSNGGAGGRGGSEFYGSCTPNTSFGMGAYALSYANFKAFMGGGGGGGYYDNGLSCTAGSRGGGIVFLNTPLIVGNNQLINASGLNVVGNTDSEGAGAGGAGGCVYLMVQNYSSAITVNVKGGNGGNIFSTLWSSACHGPGGGGGGGAIVIPQALLPAQVGAQLNGGNSGMVLHTGPACAGTPHGAQPGAIGLVVPNYQPPAPGTPPDLGPDTLMCAGGSVTLQATQAYPSYLWNTGATSASISITAPGVYWLDVPSGCATARDSIVVGILPISLSIGPDLQHCLNDSSLIQAPSGFSSYLWSTGSNAAQLYATTAGLYSLQVTNAQGCTATDSLQVSVLLPDTTTSQLNLCVGSTFSFGTQTITTSGSYQNTYTNQYGCDSLVVLTVQLEADTTSLSMQICADSTLSFYGQSITTAGTYFSHLQNINGCDSLLILTVSEWNLPIVQVADTFICANACATLVPAGALTYQWDAPQNANGSLTVCPAVTSYYTVEGTDQHGCTSLPVQAIVQVDPLPNANFYLDPNQVELDNPTIGIYNVTSGNFTHFWNLNGELIENAASSFMYTLPYAEGTYTVTLVSTNSLGCADSLTLEATVRNNFAVYVPNCFTPDGEEYNNTFCPVFSPGFNPKDYHFTIYNRWGEMVFESSDPLVGWDGYFLNLLAPAGVYTYTISFTMPGKTDLQTIEGHVNLLR